MDALITFAQAKAHADFLDAEYTRLSRILASVPGVGTGPMGLTPDSVRARPDYQEAKREADKAFADLREYNAWFVKQFKKEYRAWRRERDKARMAKIAGSVEE